MSAHIPDGFAPLQLRPNPYIDACRPLYGRRDGDALCFGLRVERRHFNPAGSCHGGMLTTLADMLLVLRLSGIAMASGEHETSFTLAHCLGEVQA